MSKKRLELLNDAQWEMIEPLLPKPKRRKDNRGRPGLATGPASRHSLDFCGPARHGGFCPTSIPLTHLLAAIEAVGRARRVAGCVAHTAGSARQRRTAAMGRVLSGRQLRSGEKGAPQSVNQAWQGHEVDGTGRRSGSSAGSSAGSALGRSYACGATLQEVRVPTPKAVATEAEKGDRRSRLRLRPLRERLKKRGIS